MSDPAVGNGFARRTRGRRAGAPEAPRTRPAEPSWRYVLRRSLEVLRPHRRLVLTALALSIVSGGLAQVNPIVFRYVLDSLTAFLAGQTALQAMLLLLGVLTLALVLKEAGLQALNVVVGYTGERIKTVSATEMSNRACAHLATLDQSFFDDAKNAPGAVVERIDRGIEGMSKIVKNLVVDILPLLLTSAFALVVMFLSNWKVGVVTLTIIPLFGYASYRQAKVNSGTRVAILQKKERRSGTFIGFLQSIQLIKAYRWESLETKRIGAINETLLTDEIRHHYVNKRYDGLKMFFENVGAVAILAVTGYLVAVGELTIGAVLLHLLLYQNVSAPVTHLHRIFDEYQEAVAFASGYFALLDEEPSLAEPAHPVRLRHVRGRVSVRCVSFAYPSKPEFPVLRDVTLDLEPGGLYALVGLNGAGKTTLAKLMLRFYDPDAGQILLDGVDLRKLTKSEIRSQVGIVLQDDHYVRGTIRDNLSQVRPGLTDAEVVRSLEEVGLGGYVAKVGLDHPANGLSKGQRQRLAIARAFLKDPRVLILDEPTAAIDPLAVREVDASLRRVCEGRTTLLISHNMSLVLEAKRIFVLEDGRLVQSGTHEELFAQDGAYGRIMRAYIETLKIEKLEVPMATVSARSRFAGPIPQAQGGAAPYAPQPFVAAKPLWAEPRIGSERGAGKAPREEG